MVASWRIRTQVAQVRLAIIVGTILISLIAPLSILGWEIRRFILTLPPWMPFNESSWILGDGNTLRDGELWYTAIRRSHFSGASTYRLKHLNLETKIDTQTEIQFSDEMGWPLSFGNDLYILSNSAINLSIKKVVGSSLVLIGPRSHDAISIEFDYEGQLTEIRETEDGGYCLFHIHDDKWTPGRRIRLPPRESKWTTDPITGKPLLIANGDGRKMKDSNQRRQFLFRAFQNGGRVYVTTSCDGSVSLRVGFEFDDAHAEIASAVEPDNINRLYSGWEKIPTTVDGRDLSSFQICRYDCDRDGFLVAMCSNDNKIRVIRRTLEGTWVNVTGLEDHRFDSHQAYFLVDVARPSTYLIVDAFVDESYAVLYRIDGNRIHSDPIVLRSALDAYFNRWWRLVETGALTWVLHWAIVGIGTLFLIRRAPVLTESQPRQFELAPAWQRSLAGVLDLCLFAAIPVAEFFSYSRDFCFLRDLREQIDLKWNVLQTIEYGGFQYLHETLFMVRVLSQLDERREFFGFLIATLVVLMAVTVYVEGRFGITVGKAIFGLRTIRTTGRPCGVAHALLRKLMLAIDFLLLLSPLPLFISLAFSDKRQRCGDRLADTVVIQAQSRPRQ